MWSRFASDALQRGKPLRIILDRGERQRFIALYQIYNVVYAQPQELARCGKVFVTEFLCGTFSVPDLSASGGFLDPSEPRTCPLELLEAQIPLRPAIL